MKSLAIKILGGLSVILAGILTAVRIKGLKKDVSTAKTEAKIAEKNAEVTRNTAEIVNKIEGETSEKIRKRRSNRNSFDNNGVR